MKVQLNQSALNLTRNQLLRQLPDQDSRRQAVDSFQGATVQDMVQQAAQRSAEERPTSAKIARNLGIASTVGAVSTSAVAVFANHSLPVLGATAGLAGLAAAGFWLSSRLTQGHRQGIQQQAEQVAQLAQQHAESLLSVQGDRVTDARFLNDFAFQNPVEIKEVGTARLLERSLTIAGEQPITLRENPDDGEVTMSWGDKTVTIDGTLELPTSAHPQATIATHNGDPDTDNLRVLEYRFDQQGKLRTHALSGVTWDSDGFSYQQNLELGANSETQINADGSVYLRNDCGRNWYGVQLPELPQPPQGQGVPGQLVVPSERNLAMKMTLNVRHAGLPESILTPVVTEPLPARVDFLGVSLHNQDNEVTIEAGDHRQTYSGQVDRKGRVQVNNHFGTLTQTLDGPASTRLEQTVLSGRIEVHHKADSLRASYFSKASGSQEATVKLTAPGAYSVLYEGGEIEMQAPVPAHLYNSPSAKAGES
jgi:hypothetical protein